MTVSEKPEVLGRSVLQLKKKRTAEHGQPLELIAPGARLYIALISVIAVTVAVFFCVATYAKKVVLPGVVAPTSGAIEVYSLRAGYVEDVYVRDQSRVSKGDRLFRLASQTRSLSGDVASSIAQTLQGREQDLNSEIVRTTQLGRNQEADIRMRLHILRSQGAELEQQIALKKSMVELAAEALEKDTLLLQSGFISQAKLRDSKIALAAARSAYSSVLTERLSLRREQLNATRELEQNRLRSENQTSQLARELKSNQEALYHNEGADSSIIVAPTSGVATAVSIKSGQTMTPSRLALVIIPENITWNIELYATSKDIGFLRSGSPVRIRYEAYPYQRFGLYKGTVTQLSRAGVAGSTLNPGLLATETYYRVTVALDKQCVMAYSRCEPLQAGMRLTASIVTDERTLLQWVLDPIRAIGRKI